MGQEALTPCRYYRLSNLLSRLRVFLERGSHDHPNKNTVKQSGMEPF
jgi:hypothetical protein